MTIAEIENALLQRVRDHLPEVETVERYAGQLEQEIDEMPFGSSAVFALYDGSDMTRADNQFFFDNAAISTVIACRNLSGRGNAQVDAYALFAQVRDLLTNQKLGLEIEPLTPTRIELVFVSGPLCVYGIRWQTAFEYTPSTPAKQ
jgi:phage gp37-like protein